MKIQKISSLALVLLVCTKTLAMEEGQPFFGQQNLPIEIENADPSVTLPALNDQNFVSSSSRNEVQNPQENESDFDVLAEIGDANPNDPINLDAQNIYEIDSEQQGTLSQDNREQPLNNLFEKIWNFVSSRSPEFPNNSSKKTERFVIVEKEESEQFEEEKERDQLDSNSLTANILNTEQSGSSNSGDEVQMNASASLTRSDLISNSQDLNSSSNAGSSNSSPLTSGSFTPLISNDSNNSPVSNQVISGSREEEKSASVCDSSSSGFVLINSSASTDSSSASQSLDPDDFVIIENSDDRGSLNSSATNTNSKQGWGQWITSLFKGLYNGAKYNAKKMGDDVAQNVVKKAYDEAERRYKKYVFSAAGFLLISYIIYKLGKLEGKFSTNAEGNNNISK